MNKDIKEKWVKALRSGEYKQTRDGGLRLVDTEHGDVGYCCLGVLCEVEGTTWQSDGVSYYRNDKGETTELADDHLADIGMTNEQQDELVAMNDSRGNSFEEIADYIEKEL